MSINIIIKKLCVIILAGSILFNEMPVIPAFVMDNYIDTYSENEDELIDVPTDESEEEALEELTEELSGEVPEEAVEEAAEKSQEESQEEATEEATEEDAEEGVEESQDESVEELDEELQEESLEEGVEESQDESLEGLDEESQEELPEVELSSNNELTDADKEKNKNDDDIASDDLEFSRELINEQQFRELVSIETTDFVCNGENIFIRENFFSTRVVINDINNNQPFIAMNKKIVSLLLYVDGILYEQYDVTKPEFIFNIDCNDINKSIDMVIILGDGSKCGGHILSGNVIYDNILPSIVICREQADYHTDSIDYYKDFISFKVVATDKESGILAGKVMINDTVFILETDGGETQSVTKELALSSSMGSNNIFTVKVEVYDNAGNQCTKEEVMVVDNIMPQITSIDCDDNQSLIGDSDNFGYFTDEDLYITVSCEDNENGSGVAAVYYCLEGEAEIKGELKDGSIIICIPADYLGGLFVRCVDNTGNQSEINTTVAIVLEKSETFRDRVRINVNMPDTEFKDEAGNLLYNQGISIPVSIREDYGGIKCVVYYLISEGEIISKGDFQYCKGMNISDRYRNLVYEGGFVINADYDCNNISLVIEVTGNNGHFARKTILFSMDQTPPILSLEITRGYSEGIYNTIFNNDVEVAIFVSDKNCSRNGLKYYINGVLSEYGKCILESQDNLNYICEYCNDGSYCIEAEFTDLAGNRVTANLPGFTIDKTAPVISVIYEDEGIASLGNSNEYLLSDINKEGDIYFYNHNRYAYLNIEDDNFFTGGLEISCNAFSNIPVLSEDWLCEGNNSLGKLYFTEDGYYQYSISVTDKAGNKSNVFVSQDFIIDSVNPVISIEGIENNQSYGKIGEIEISAEDINYKNNSLNIYVEEDGEIVPVSYEINKTETGENVVLQDISELINTDSHYTLTACAQDKAGNMVNKSLNFTLNRNGSRYKFFESSYRLNGKYMNTSKGIGLSETNMDMLSDITAHICVNGKTTDIKEGQGFIVNRKYEDKQYIYSYFLSPKLFSESGVYKITFSSTDKAGNVNNSYKNSNEILSFAVDKSKPQISFINIKDGEIIDADLYEGKIFISDNMGIKSVKVYVDDREYIYSSTESVILVDLHEADNYQKLQVYVTDEAGNESYGQVNVLLSALKNNNDTSKIRSDLEREIIFLILGITAIAVFSIFKNRNRTVS